MVEEKRYLSAREAAEELGVSLPTLYAYVSRGMVRSEAAGGSRRSRRYHGEDVRRLRERKERRRDPESALEGALRWGAPMLESGITLVADGRVYYRGRDALELSRSRSIEEVAALIWTGELPGDVAGIFGADVSGEPFMTGMEPAMRPVSLESLQSLLPLAATEDSAAYDLRPRGVAKTGARILRLMAGSIVDGVEVGSIAEALQRGWVPDDPWARRLLDAALIICADHELPVSTFVVRCVASSGATPYAAVTAGLSAMQGVKHGGQIELVEKLLQEVEISGDARVVMGGRLRRGESIPGFGHQLYPEGDPRGAELIRLSEAARPESVAVQVSAATSEVALEVLGERPTLDLGLVTLARALDLPPGGALALFALGRTVGWIGHAIEQYASDTLIRPRARYVGEPPQKPV
ncbi:MAG: citrate synthase family protein [Rubrobacteraceae bacterium]